MHSSMREHEYCNEAKTLGNLCDSGCTESEPSSSHRFCTWPATLCETHIGTSLKLRGGVGICIQISQL